MLSTSRDGAVSLLTLGRPERRNALNLELARAIWEAAQAEVAAGADANGAAVDLGFGGLCALDLFVTAEHQHAALPVGIDIDAHQRAGGVEQKRARCDARGAERARCVQNHRLPAVDALGADHFLFGKHGIEGKSCAHPGPCPWLPCHQAHGVRDRGLGRARAQSEAAGSLLGPTSWVLFCARPGRATSRRGASVVHCAA